MKKTNLVLINTDYIKLDQALKLSGICGTGADAKQIIKSGDIEVNGEIEIRRGRKLRDGDRISFNNEIYILRQDGGGDGDQEASSY